MKAKLIGVLVAVAALFIGAVLWRTDSFVYGDRMSWVEAQTRTQVGAMNQALGAELKSLQRVVVSFTPDSFQKDRINWGSLAPYYAAASFVVNGNKLDPQVVVVKENSKAATWDQAFLRSALADLDGKTPEMRFYIKPFQDTKQGKHVALIFLEAGRAYALMGSGELFQSLIDTQKGSLNSFSIVTTKGLTVGHSTPEYMGTVMRDDPVFRDAQKSGSSHGSNTYALKTGEMYGMYELVPRSNLFILSSASLKGTMQGRTGLWWQFLLLGAGLILVALAAILWVVTPAEKQIDELGQQLKLLQLKTSAAVPVAVPTATVQTSAAKVVLPDPEQMHKEKVQASMRVASALAHEMRGPLASILGYSQMILAKSPESDIVQSTESILRETRAARSVLDKLLGYAGEEIQEKNSMKVEGPLVKALKEMESLFADKGVKITKQIQETASLELHVDAIIRALKNILLNSVEAMERMANKEITVELFEDAEGVHLNIQDTGEGIEPQNAEKIFDPFYTTRSFQHHMGLGLSVAFGILKEHNADIKVESQRGQGTKVSVLFKPAVKTASVLKAPVEASPMIVEEHVEIQSEPLVESVNQSVAPASPLDINIDAMLDLPELAEAAPASKDVAEVAAVVAEQKAPTPASKVEPSSVPRSAVGDDDLIFIDDFLEGQNKALTNEMAAPSEAAESSETVVLSPEASVTGAVTSEELETMTDGPVSAGFIVPPQQVAARKKSKLDSYQVDIRRPGKRI